jgi:hypothetical protein
MCFSVRTFSLPLFAPVFIYVLFSPNCTCIYIHIIQSQLHLYLYTYYSVPVAPVFIYVLFSPICTCIHIRIIQSHLHLYLYTYYSVPITPYSKYIFKTVTGTVCAIYHCTHCICCLCSKSLYREKTRVVQNPLFTKFRSILCLLVNCRVLHTSFHLHVL